MQSFQMVMGTVGYMAVFPTMIFYVRQLGGTESQYGMLLSVPNLVGFFATPLYGSWVRWWSHIS